MRFQKFSLSWQNINIEILEKTNSFWKTSVKKKTILDNVSGCAKSNTLIALMGSSGSGKTSLLSAISGRRKGKTGVLRINNNVISDEDIRSTSGYLHQEDIFTEYLTVFEHLKFMAALQLNRKNKEERTTIIKQLLSELSLEDQSTTLIKNLSGGQRRRLSLAGELLSNPFILFCDEPTTGLDSYSAILVVQKLRTIALSGKIVLAAIHQPSSQLFQQFHNITLLAEGKLVFQGTAEEAQSFFESMNLFCPSTYNPADFYIKCLSEAEVPKMCERFETRKKQPKKYCPQCDHLDNISLEKKVNNPSFFCDLRWLLWRCYIENKRNKAIRLGSYFFVVVEIIAIAIFYSEVTFDGKNTAQNIQGFLAFIGSEFTFTQMYAVINVFPAELVVFLREKNLYSTYAYFTSKVLSMVPLIFISTVTYMSILFIIVNYLNGIYLWLQMTYLTFLVGLSACGLGLAFSATFSTVEHVDLFLGPLEFLLLLFSGLLVQLNSIPGTISWVKYISPFHYSFESLSNLFWNSFSYSGNCTGNESIPCYSNGTQVLQIYGIYKTYDIVAYDILYLHILTAAFCLMGFAGILRKKILYSI